MKWVKCSERLPEELEWVILYIPEERTKKVHIGYREKSYSNPPNITFEIGHCPGDYYGECSSWHVTHWMELPEMPDE